VIFLPLPQGERDGRIGGFGPPGRGKTALAASSHPLSGGNFRKAMIKILWNGAKEYEI
jgi:hypothetical protein